MTVKGFPDCTGTCPTKECAKKCAAKAEADLLSGRQKRRMELKELFALYEEKFLPTIPATAPLYHQHLEWWKDEIGDYSISAVTPLVIAECKAKLAAGTTHLKRRRGPATVNRYLITLSSVYTWACSAEVKLADYHPVRDVQRLKEPPGRVRWLTRPVDEEFSELERLLAACRSSLSPILFDVVMLLLSTGCRLHEILRIQRWEVHLAEGGFTIPASRAKNGTARFVPLEGPGLDIMRARLAKKHAGNVYLFPGVAARPARLPRGAWETALRRAGISNLRIHDLRHTHGSYLGMMGKSLPEIMQALGHKTPAVALRYTHLADSHKRQVSREVNTQLVEWISAAQPTPP